MQHLIKKQELLLRIAEELEPFGIQHAASGFYKDRLLSVLESVFDEVSTEEEVILIDRLVIDIGPIAAKSLRGDGPADELYSLIKKELLRVLKGERPEVGLLRADLRENALSQWWYYMEKGRLPWNATAIDDDWYHRVLEILSVDYGSVTRLRRALEGRPAFSRRVSHQHSDEFLETLTGILTGVRQPLLAQRVEAVCVLSQWLEKTFYEMTAIIGAQPGPAEKRASTIRVLRRWMETHVSFLALPGAERKAAVWGLLVRVAAMQPGNMRATGADWLLLREFLSPDDRAIHQLLRESGVDVPAEWFAPGSFDAGKSVTAEPGAGKGPVVVAKRDEPGSAKSAAAVEKRDEPEAGDRAVEGRGEIESAMIEREGAQTAKENGHERPESDKIAAPEERPEEGGLFGRHAGLILLHPFLSTLFHRCGLWVNGEFPNLRARQRAVFLLYFLATGEKEAPEYELLFPKLLCGYDMEEPLPARMDIPECDWFEAGELLLNVLVQWDKLKSTSVRGLREGFLQRTGKLVRRNERTQLQLEISGVDILLDFLPWGLSIVKLPWLKEILYVEWR